MMQTKSPKNDYAKTVPHRTEQTGLVESLQVIGKPHFMHSGGHFIHP